MKNKFKTITFITLFFLIGIGIYFYLFGKSSEINVGIPENNIIVGDKASYLNFDSCDEYSKLVIDKLSLDKNKIHSCSSTKVENEDYYLVEIESGEAQDCPAGCFYETNIYKVSNDKKNIEEFNDGIEKDSE